MTNLLGLIISFCIIIWGLSIIWSIKEMIYSPLDNYDISPIIISFIGVIPIINIIITIILIIYKNKTNMKNPFKRKLTTEYIRKHYPKLFDNAFETHIIGQLNKNKNGAFETLTIEIRKDRFCLTRNFYFSSYWLIDVEYVSDLKKLIKLYKVTKTSN